jgi:hypothetical protein
LVSEKKIFKKSSWGGKRENAGRKRKYEPIKLGFKIESQEDIPKILKLVPKLILEDRIEPSRARALVFSIRALAEIGFRIDEFDERLDKLEKIAGISDQPLE